MRGFVSATKAFTVSGNGRRVLAASGPSASAARTASAGGSRRAVTASATTEAHTSADIATCAARAQVASSVRTFAPPISDLADEQRQRERRQPNEPVGPRHHRSRADEAPDARVP